MISISIEIKKIKLFQNLVIFLIGSSINYLPTGAIVNNYFFNDEDCIQRIILSFSCSG